jgi:hypothetical protein
MKNPSGIAPPGAGEGLVKSTKKPAGLVPGGRGRLGTRGLRRSVMTARDTLRGCPTMACFLGQTQELFRVRDRFPPPGIKMFRKRCEIATFVQPAG